MNENEVRDLIHRAKAYWPDIDSEEWAPILAPAEFREARDALAARKQDPTTPTADELRALIPPRGVLLSKPEIDRGLAGVAWLRDLHKRSREGTK